MCPLTGLYLDFFLLGGGLLAFLGGGLLAFLGGGEAAGAVQVVTTLTSWPIWQWLENWHLK